MDNAALVLLVAFAAACTTTHAPAPPAPAPAPPPPPAAAESEPESVSEPLVLDAVGPFPSDVATPGPRLTPLLETIAAKLRARPAVTVAIAGHCDDTEKEEVAYARANLVASGLAARGVPRTRVRVETYGALRPIAPNDSPENRAKNRRVDFEVLER